MKSANYIGLKLLIFLIGMALYLPTVSYDYTVDDKMYITQNDFVKSGWSGLREVWTTDMLSGYDGGSHDNLLEGGRYRPLALSIHIAEREFFGESPFFGHLLNAIFNGILGLVVFAFLLRLFENASSKNLIGILTISTIAFIAHPLHSEAIANIKNRDEMLSCIFGIVFVVQLIDFTKSQKIRHLLFSIIGLLAALFIKESSVNFIGIALLYYILSYSKIGSSKKLLFTTGGAVGLAFIGYYLLRMSSISEVEGSMASQQLLNNVYLNASVSEKVAGILFVFGLGLLRLIKPFPLTHDYYPYHPFRTFEELEAGISGYPQWSDAMLLFAVISLMVIIGLVVKGLFKFRQSEMWKMVLFGLLLYLGSSLIFSNIFFPIGSFFNERFLFIPSLALPILLAQLLIYLNTFTRAKIYNGLAVVFCGYLMVFTLIRIPDWKSDNHLVLNDVKVSGGSARANLLAAEASLNLHKTKANNALLNPGFSNYLEQGEVYAKRALFIYPEYLAPLDMLGNIAFEKSDFDQSFEYFRNHALRKEKGFILNNMKIIADLDFQNNRNDEALKKYRQIIGFGDVGYKVNAFTKMAEIWGARLGNSDSSEVYLNRAVAIAPNDALVLQQLGVLNAIKGNLDKAEHYFSKSLEIDPNNEQVKQNLKVLQAQKADRR